MSSVIQPKGAGEADWTQPDPQKASKKEKNVVSNIGQKALVNPESEGKNLKGIKSSSPTHKRISDKTEKNPIYTSSPDAKSPTEMEEKKTINRRSFRTMERKPSNLEAIIKASEEADSKTVEKASKNTNFPTEMETKKPMRFIRSSRAIERKPSNLEAIIEVPEEAEKPVSKTVEKSSKTSVANIAEEFKTINLSNKHSKFYKAGEQITEILNDKKIGKKDKEIAITDKIMRQVFAALDCAPNTKMENKRLKLEFINHLNKTYNLNLSNFLDTYTTQSK